MKNLNTILAVLGAFPALCLPMRADVFGKFTYTDDGTSITIDGYPDTETGSVTIPSTIVDKPVTRIGNYAFSGCSGLTSVVIPSGVTRIEEGAFSYCQGLTSLTIPSSVTSIGGFSFLQCFVLTNVSIPSSVTEIGLQAFQDCTGLTNVTIPSSVTNIGIGIFTGCTGLESATFMPGATTTGDHTFYGCTGLTSVTMPASMTRIGSRTFSNCAGLDSISIPSGVTDIGEYAFEACNGLDGIAIPPGVTLIRDYTFSDCKQLTSVVIPPGVTSIGRNAFSFCNQLANVSIPSGVTSIGIFAFGDCVGLASVTIPSSVTSIRQIAFKGCLSLTEAIFLGNAPTMESGVFDGADDSFRIYFRFISTGFTIPTWYGYPASLFTQSSEIAVEHPIGTNLVDNANVLAFGSSHIGSSVIKTFTIRNSGGADLLGLAVESSGPHASEFSIGTLGSTQLAPGASTTFTVTFTPESTGSRSAALKIASNDVNENPFDIALSGKGTIPPAPEITVQQGPGPGKNLRDNRAVRDFGSVKVGKSSRVMVFVIKNDGSARLTSVNVAMKGRLAGDFRIVKKPAKSLAPRASTQFKVIYKPAKVRISEVLLQITSNDKDENPFRVELTGNGAK